MSIHYFTLWVTGDWIDFSTDPLLLAPKGKLTPFKNKLLIIQQGFLFKALCTLEVGKYYCQWDVDLKAAAMKCILLKKCAFMHLMSCKYLQTTARLRTCKDLPGFSILLTGKVGARFSCFWVICLSRYFFHFSVYWIIDHKVHSKSCLGEPKIYHK